MKKEILPTSFKVLYRLGDTPLSMNYICFCKTRDGYALAYFDGIEEMPTLIEQFYEIE